MPNTIVNDGSVVAGSRDLTINAVVYATDDFKLDTDSTEILRTDKNNVPSGRKVTRGQTTGTATLQLATAATAVPDFGMQFTTTEGTCTITKVGRTETKAGESKVPISFALNITGSIVIT